MSPFSEAVAAAVNPYLVDNSTPTSKAAQNLATTIALQPVVQTDQNNMQHPTSNFHQSSPSGSKRPTLLRELSREDMDLEVNTVQKDLDHLKDMLSGQITLDSSLISNLFNPDESLSSLFSGQDLNLGPFSPPTVNQSNQQSTFLQPLEMENPSSKDVTSLMISPAASAAQQHTAAAAQGYVQNSNDIEDQPPLFEFADIDDMDEPIEVVEAPTENTTGEKQKNLRSINMPMKRSADSLSLNTPMVSSGDDLENPFLKSIINRKKK